MPDSESRGLSLWKIDQTLSDLLALREEVTDESEIAAIDGQITEWIHAELLKFDSCFGFIRASEQRADVAKAIAKEAVGWQHIHENRARRVRNVVKEVMINRGLRKLEGAVGSFTVRNNGGLTPLEIEPGCLLPDDYRRIAVTMPRTVWRRVQQLLEPEDHGLLLSLLMTVVETVDEAKLRKALEAGEQIPGATLKPRGTSLMVR